MTAPGSFPLSEQVALLGGQGDPFWAGRLSDDDEVAGLGETFVLNGLVSPVRSATARLVVPAAAEAARIWLADVLPRADEGIYTEAAFAGTEPAVLLVADLGERAGLALAGLPEPYADWRLGVELYVLLDRSLYLVGGELAARYKLLADAELGIAFGGRMLPFLPEGEEPSGAMVFVVGVPARTASLGGLRGFRRGLLDAGQALATLRALATGGEGRWLWETEFFDDACARVLGVDGVDRIPLAIGVHVVPSGEEVGT